VVYVVLYLLHHGAHLGDLKIAERLMTGWMITKYCVGLIDATASRTNDRCAVSRNELGHHIRAVFSPGSDGSRSGRLGHASIRSAQATRLLVSQRSPFGRGRISRIVGGAGITRLPVEAAEGNFF
jgi:hypothetical protein